MAECGDTGPPALISIKAQAPAAWEQPGHALLPIAIRQPSPTPRVAQAGGGRGPWARPRRRRIAGAGRRGRDRLRGGAGRRARLDAARAGRGHAVARAGHRGRGGAGRLCIGMRQAGCGGVRHGADRGAPPGRGRMPGPAARRTAAGRRDADHGGGRNRGAGRLRRTLPAGAACGGRGAVAGIDRGGVRQPGQRWHPGRHLPSPSWP